MHRVTGQGEQVMPLSLRQRLGRPFVPCLRPHHRLRLPAPGMGGPTEVIALYPDLTCFAIGGSIAQQQPNALDQRVVGR